MRTLREGMMGADVIAWQNFLRGMDPYSDVVADGTFDDVTVRATKEFQSDQGIQVDGEVGEFTLSKALALGYGILRDAADWPPRPSFRALTPQDRTKIFGNFAYVASPNPSNPEAIKITDGWADDNIVTVKTSFPDRLRAPSVQFNKNVSVQFLTLLSRWDAAGLTDKILTWGGSYAPRFIRGSRSTLSNHAWGTAFDINVQWNQLGATPARLRSTGCVRELVTIANECGFFWGGHFTRLDGMHFEVAQLVT